MNSLNSKHFWLLLVLSAVWAGTLFDLRRAAQETERQPIETTEVYPEQRFLRGEKLDLNRASLRELTALPGVGPKLAEEILRHRRKRGPFPNVEALRNVRGIGPAKLEKIRPLVVVMQEAGR